MTQLDHLGQRLVGCILIAGALFVFDPARSSVVHQLVLPLVLIIGALLLTRALTAAAIALAALSLAKTNIGSDQWSSAWAYPGLALSALSWLGWRVYQVYGRVSDKHD